MSGFTAKELAELRAKAEAATGGEWRSSRLGAASFVYSGPDPVARMASGSKLRTQAKNAAFIAALNPATALRLIQSAELVSELVGRLELARAGLHAGLATLSAQSVTEGGRISIMKRAVTEIDATLAKAKAGGA